MLGCRLQERSPCDWCSTGQQLVDLDTQTWLLSPPKATSGTIQCKQGQAAELVHAACQVPLLMQDTQFAKYPSKGCVVEPHCEAAIMSRCAVGCGVWSNHVVSASQQCLLPSVALLRTQHGGQLDESRAAFGWFAARAALLLDVVTPCLWDSLHASIGQVLS